MITQNRLKELFDYQNGELIRKKTGKPATVKQTQGHRYLRMTVDSKVASVHRMVFLWHHGYLPKITDHIDGNRLNNQIENLILGAWGCGVFDNDPAKISRYFKEVILDGYGSNIKRIIFAIINQIKE